MAACGCACVRTCVCVRVCVCVCVGRVCVCVFIMILQAANCSAEVILRRNSTQCQNFEISTAVVTDSQSFTV